MCCHLKNSIKWKKERSLVWVLLYRLEKYHKWWWETLCHTPYIKTTIFLQHNISLVYLLAGFLTKFLRKLNRKSQKSSLFLLECHLHLKKLFSTSSFHGLTKNLTIVLLIEYQFKMSCDRLLANVSLQILMTEDPWDCGVLLVVLFEREENLHETRNITFQY